MLTSWRHRWHYRCRLSSGHIAAAKSRISSSENLSSHHRRVASVTVGGFAP
jgi:hypothetical protein